MLGYIAQMGFLSGIGEAITNAIKGAFDFIFKGIWNSLSSGACGVIKAIYGKTKDGADLVLKYNDLNNSIYNSLWELAKTIYTALAVIGVGLCLMYWLIGIIDKLTKDKLSSYMLIRSFIELIVALTVVVAGFDAFKWIANIGVEIAGYITKAEISTNVTGEPPYEAFCFGLSYKTLTEDGSPLGFLCSFIGMILAFIYLVFAWGCYAYCTSIVIARVIQTALYVAMAPIAVSQMCNKGSILDSSAMGFIKKLAALSIQGPIIIFIMSAAMAIQSQATGAGTSLVLLIAVNLVAVSLCMKSNSFANDIVA